MAPDLTFFQQMEERTYSASERPLFLSADFQARNTVGRFGIPSRGGLQLKKTLNPYYFTLPHFPTVRLLLY